MANDRLIGPDQQEWIVGTPIPSGLAVTPSVGNDLALPITYAAVGLPNGVSIASNGILSGTPVVSQLSREVQIIGTDANGLKLNYFFNVLVFASTADANNVNRPGFQYDGSHCGLSASPGSSFGTMANPAVQAAAAVALAYP